MKIQLSSNTNFNSRYYYRCGGILLYKSKTGDIAKGSVKNHLPRDFAPYIYDIDKKLDGEFFNVLISRGEHWRDFNVQAKALFSNMQTQLIQVKLKKGFGLQNTKDLIDTVYKTIDNMKELLGTKQILQENLKQTTKEKPNSSLWENLKEKTKTIFKSLCF